MKVHEISVHSRPAAGGKARILLAEDDPDDRWILSRLLERLGYWVTAVVNGEQALAAAKGGGFDLILMHCRMPLLDGIEATSRIRDLPGELSLVPIVGMSSGMLAYDRSHCLEAGMDDHIPKPLRHAELRAVLERYLRRS